MAASHASCFAMALNGTLGRKGGAASRTVVTATIFAEKGETGIKLTTSKLHIAAEGVTGLDAAQFREAAKEAEGKCPISMALRASLDIQLEVDIR